MNSTKLIVYMVLIYSPKISGIAFWSCVIFVLNYKEFLHTHACEPRLVKPETTKKNLLSFNTSFKQWSYWAWCLEKKGSKDFAIIASV